MENRNPLHTLGNYTWADYGVFKSHLRLPAPTLKIIFRNYANLNEAVYQLPKLLKKYDSYLWEKRMEEATLIEKQYRAANIPPLYHNNDSIVICTTVNDQADYQWLKENIYLVDSMQFYFWSTFSDAANNAAFAIMKSAIQHKVRSYAVSLVELLAEYKDDFNVYSNTQQRIRNDQLAVIYYTGAEYTTEFTANYFKGILDHRKANKLVTLVCSSLSPKEYTARYKMEPEGVIVGFQDQKIKKTLADIRKELEG